MLFRILKLYDMCNNWQYFDGNDNYNHVEGVDADDQRRTFAGGLCKHSSIDQLV